MLVVTYILVQLFAHTVTQWAILGDPGRSGPPIMLLVRDSWHCLHAWVKWACALSVHLSRMYPIAWSHVVISCIQQRSVYRCSLCLHGCTMSCTQLGSPTRWGGVKPLLYVQMLCGCVFEVAAHCVSSTQCTVTLNWLISFLGTWDPPVCVVVTRAIVLVVTALQGTKECELHRVGSRKRMLCTRASWLPVWHCPRGITCWAVVVWHVFRC